MTIEDFLDNDTQELIEYLYTRTFMKKVSDISILNIKRMANYVLDNTVGLKPSDIKTIATYKVMHESISNVIAFRRN